MIVDESIVLEVIDDKHAEPLYELTNRHREYLREWLPWVDAMHTVEGFKRYVELCRKRHWERVEIGYVIVVEGMVAGRIGMYHFDHQNKIASIGYWLAEDFQGRGIITRACQKIIHYGFTELGMNRIEIKCATGNVKSQAIPERLHFTREGVIRQGEWHREGFLDLYLYSLLRDEWSGE